MVSSSSSAAKSLLFLKRPNPIFRKLKPINIAMTRPVARMSYMMILLMSSADTITWSWIVREMRFSSVTFAASRLVMLLIK
jgi:hypothetical protein